MSDTYFAPRRVMPVSALTPEARKVDEIAKAVRADDLALLREKVARVLSTPDGRDVLEHLLDITLRAQPVSPFNEHLGGSVEKVALTSAYRAGQNSILQHILSLAVQAEGQPGFFMKPPI